jgi:hypothetical protein
MPYCEGGVFTDGLLTDAFWLDPCNWMDLDLVYDGTPSDITSAEYAVCWGDGLTDPCSRIFAAVRVVDTDQTIVPLLNHWNDQDHVEVYVQGDPNGGHKWGSSDSQDFDVAQQFMIGKQTTFGSASWHIWGDGTVPIGGGDPASAKFLGGVRKSGSTLSYEIETKAWQGYGGRSGQPHTEPELNPGDHVGFDIVAVTVYGATPRDPDDDGEYGVLSANLDMLKFKDAAQFQRWELKDYDGTSVPPECGDWGILVADIYLDTDCQVGLPDFGVIANEWMDCTDPCAPCGYDPF